MDQVQVEPAGQTGAPSTAETPGVDGPRAQHIQAWASRIKAAKKHWEDDFKRMREDMRMARTGAAADQTGDFYVANIIQRVINRTVSQLYARNPRAVAKRKKRRDFKLWDGNPQSLITALQTPLEPTAMMLLADVAKGEQRRVMYDGVGKTLEILFNHFLNDQEPKFKTQAKQLVRRARVVGIGYMKLGFKRAIEMRPEAELQYNDIAARIAEMERVVAQINEGEGADNDVEVERLRLLQQQIQEEGEHVVYEGLSVSFPKVTSIIPDPATTQIKGWIGTGWIAEEFHKTPAEVQRIYGVDVRSSYLQHKAVNQARLDADGKSDLACLWLVQDKITGTTFVICDGYPDYIKAPTRPDVWLERFYDIFSLSFNDIEDEERIFPLSDVSLLAPMQTEYNRSRQGLREHRVANRPQYVTPKGKLDGPDKTALQSGATSALIELNGLQPGEKVDDVLQAIRKHPVSADLYDTAPIFEDILRTSGSQEANLGPTTGATATESSIAETSRLGDNSSAVDDLDDFLTDMARAAGQILLMEMSPEHVERIVGPGAVWPQLSRQEIVDEIYLDIKAGSSGRPNKAVALANFERAAPTIIQLPGVNPTYIAKKLLELLDDDDLEVEEAILDGMPSMVALNAMAGRGSQPATGDPASDPGSQDGRGGEVNSPRRTRGEPGPQPAYPDATQSSPGVPA